MYGYFPLYDSVKLEIYVIDKGIGGILKRITFLDSH